MSRPSNFAVLGLFARVALRRAANGTAIFVQRTSQNLTKATARKATVPRGLQKSLGSRTFAVFFTLSLAFGTIMLLTRPVPCTTQAVHLDELEQSKVIPLTRADYEALQTASKSLPPKQTSEAVDTALSKVIEGMGADWLDNRAKALLHDRFVEQGLAGFKVAEPDPEWRGALATLSPEGRLRALRATGLYLLLIGGSGVLLTIGVMSRSLSQTDPSLTWLFQFPVSRPILFVSKLGEYTVGNLIGPIAAILAAMLLWGFGASFTTGLILSLVFGLASAVTVGSLCLALEMLLSQRCRRKFRGACVSSATAIASCGLMFGAYYPNASPTTQFVLWISDRLPNFVFWNPLSLGVGTVQMADGIGLMWWIGPPVTAFVFALGAVVLATRLTVRGLATANDSAPAAARRTSIEPVSEGRLRGLVWKEMLQVRRQPEFLAQVFSAPFVIGFLLYIRNPDQFMKVAAGDVAGLCVSAFAAASYLLIVAGSAVLRTELRTLWFLQCQPRSLADSFRTKARIWAVISMAMGATLLAGIAVFQPGHLGGIAIRAPFAIVYLWLLAEISFGLLTLGATVVNETTVRFKRLQWMVPLLISGQCAATIYRGTIWEQCALLAVLIVLSMAVRQKQVADLAWLSEPVENPPVRFDLLDGLVVLLAFLTVRDLCSGLLDHAVGSVPLAVGGGYVIAALVTWAITSIWMRRTQRRIAIPEVSAPRIRPVAIGLAATYLVGLLWVGLLRHSSEAALAQTNMKVPTTLAAGTAGNWVFLATIVLAAPIFEEWPFRGLLYRSLRHSWGMLTSVAISAVLFTSIHPMASSVAVLCLGITTALVLEKTNRLWPSMIVHIGYNAFIVGLWNIPL